MICYSSVVQGNNEFGGQYCAHSNTLLLLLLECTGGNAHDIRIDHAHLLR